MLWLIFVPRDKPPFFQPGKKRHFSTKYHRMWDQQVMALTGGMTIFLPSKGRWVSPEGVLYHEDMIPVILSCTAEKMVEVCNLTAKHYGQIAVPKWKLGDDAVIISYPENLKYHNMGSTCNTLNAQIAETLSKSS